MVMLWFVYALVVGVLCGIKLTASLLIKHYPVLILSVAQVFLFLALLINSFIEFYHFSRYEVAGMTLLFFAVELLAWRSLRRKLEQGGKRVS